MAIDVTTQTVVQRPRAEVSAFATDPDNVPRWYANIGSVRWLTDRPAAVGTRLEFSASFVGRTLSYVYVIRELVPGQRLVMSTDSGLFPMETTYTWEDVAGGTRMTLRNRGLPTGFSRLLSPLLAVAVRRANTKDLAALRNALED